MGVEFTTREYVKAHGKQPRGRGSWAFCPVQNYNASNYLDFVYWTRGSMTFTEAKRDAAKHFNAQPGTNVVVVCS